MLPRWSSPTSGMTSPSAVVVILVVLTGCIGVPLAGDAEQGTSVTLVSNSSVAEPYTLEVFVVDLPANVSVNYSDERAADTEIDEGVSLVDSGEYYYTDVTPAPEVTRHHGNVTVPSGASATTTVTGLHQRGAVIVAAYDERGRITSYVVANCDDLALSYLQIRLESDGASITHACS